MPTQASASTPEFQGLRRLSAWKELLPCTNVSCEVLLFTWHVPLRLNANGWPTAASAGSVKGARGILAQGMPNTSACLAGFSLNGHQNETARRPHFWDGLVFETAWRSLFWSRLAAISTLVVGGAGASKAATSPVNESSEGNIFLGCKVQCCDFTLVSLWAMRLCPVLLRPLLMT